MCECSLGSMNVQRMAVTTTMTRVLSLMTLLLVGCLGLPGEPEGQSGLGLNPSAEDGTPVFIQEPPEYSYIVRNQPVTITCRASPAVQINFKCAEQWVRPKHHRNQEVEEGGVTSLVTSIDVTREEVEQYFGLDGYWCECHAWNSLPEVPKPKSAKSARGLVQIAYIKKRFEREPLSKEVELKSQVSIDCLPPEGLPLPTVFWLKDGNLIDVDADINYIISSEGNLLISQARLSDSGNYTCGAENMQGRRLSESATLTVLVHGNWATWSAWSDCSSKCGKGWQRRSRVCNNPTPSIRGNDCFGEALQRVECQPQCPEGLLPNDNPESSVYKVDGGWSTWSSWSTCSPDCRHHRRRLCDNPPPQFEGSQCDGGDLDTANCTGAMCRDVALYEKGGPDVRNEIPEENIAKYVGLIAAVAVSITILIIVIFVLRRKVKGQGSPAKLNKSGHTDLLRTVQPDLTQTVVTIQNHHTLDKQPNNNHLGNNLSHGGTLNGGSHYANGTLRSNNSMLDDKEPIYSNIEPLDNTLNTQKSLMLMEAPPTPAKNPADFASPSHQATNRSPSVSDNNDTRPNSDYSEQRHSSISSHLPSNIDLEALAIATVTHTGGRISLNSSGVSVIIPEGAIKKGCSEEIFLAVCRDDKDRPKLEDTQTVLGPVIMLGPQGLALKKPVIVSFQHCASIKHGQWLLSMYGSDSPYDEQPAWQNLCVLGQETINTPVYMQVDLNQSHMMSEYLQRYVLVGEPHMAGKAIKILRLAAFAPAVPSGLDYNVRVYFLEDTQDALENVLQVEYRLGGRLLDKPKQVFFQYGGGNLCLSIEELGAGWRCKLNANYQEIPFGHIWSGTQNGLHCSFALEHTERSQQVLQANIHVFQKAQVANSQVLQISANLTEKVPASPAHLVSQTTPSHHNSTVTSTGAVTLDPPNSVFRLPNHVRSQLSQILDPPNQRGNDWRMLAQRLSVDRYINYFATKKSPTEHILDLWEARHREESAVTDLMNSLRVMGRMDAAAVLEKQFSSWL